MHAYVLSDMQHTAVLFYVWNKGRNHNRTSPSKRNEFPDTVGFFSLTNRNLLKDCLSDFKEKKSQYN